MNRPADGPRPTRIAALVLAWLVVLLIDAVAVAGLARLEFGHGLDRVFQDGSERYGDYAALVEAFGSGDGVLIRVGAEDLAATGPRAALEAFVIEMHLVDPDWTVISPFSIPLADGAGGVTTLNMLDGEAWAGAQAAHPMLAHVLTPDHEAALVTVLGAAGEDQIAAIRALAGEHLEAAGLEVGLSGLPVILDRSRALLMRDFVFLNAVGAAIGVGLTLLVMNSVWLAAISLMSTATALLWAMGAMGWTGMQINVISIALPVLVLALALSDAVHVALEQRALALGGAPHSVARALRRIGPAVLLTSLTTALAFASLGISDSPLLADLGAAGAVAVMVAAFGGLAAQGLIVQTLLGLMPPARIFPPHRRGIPAFFDWQALARFGLAAPRAISAATMIVALVATGLYLTAPPRFSLDENLRDQDPARTVLRRIEADFGPMAAMQIPVEIGPDGPLHTARAVIAALPEELAPDVVSLSALADAAEAASVPLDALATQLPPPMRAMLTGSEAGRLLVSVPFPYVDAARTRALATTLEAHIAAAAPPDLAARIGRPTGPHVMSAFLSETMIRSLSLSLLLAVLASGAVIALWRRSLTLGLVALVPNVLPVALAGAAMAISGHGVTFAAGVALTLAFGISVDDTIHVLNRLRLAGRDPAHARDPLASAMRQVTPALVATTVILAGGLSGTFGATLPTVVAFGMFTIFVLLVALVSDLLVLPAMLRRFAR